MRLTVVCTLLIPAALAQQTSPTGFGRAIYPGTGGPTGPAGRVGTLSPSVGGAGFGRVIYPGTGGPAVGVRPGVNPAFIGVPPQRPNHQQHGRSAIIPFPVFYGGGYYNSFEPPQAAVYSTDYYNAAERSPVVIINQSFQPETINPQLRDYSNTPLPEAAARPAPRIIERDPHADDPTVIQIALTDGSIYEAVGYWVEGDTLNYITVEGVHNRATLDLVDRDRSKRLNDEKKVEFKLPRR